MMITSRSWTDLTREQKQSRLLIARIRLIDRQLKALLDIDPWSDEDFALIQELTTKRYKLTMELPPSKLWEYSPALSSAEIEGIHSE